MDWTKIAPPLAAISAIFVACLAGGLTFLNAELQKVRKRRDLYRLLKAEITNLERHCRVSSKELFSLNHTSVCQLRMAKYRDGSMLLFESKESYLLNQNICQDLMQLSLLSRNDDIWIDETINYIRTKEIDDKLLKNNINEIARRLRRTTSISELVLANLEAFVKSPRSYDRPVINW